MSDSYQIKPSRWVLGTPLVVTNYTELAAFCQHLAAKPGSTAIDFTNTHIVTMRRHQNHFAKLTRHFDLFIPDGMPLVWCLNFQGASLQDRVYGPTFMRCCLLTCPAPYTHYFLGASESCLAKLKEIFRTANPAIQIIGSCHGYFKQEESDRIIEEINRLSPDFIWVGLGTPKQQIWIHEYKHKITRGVILAVGFAFDVNAGTKKDAPLWMQRSGLTWLFRLCREPRRLLSRYLLYNSLFLFYLCWDGARGRAFVPSEPSA